MSYLKLGVIGLSEGNGHPYSWSAIFNGYNSVAMEECPFPTIPRYLEKQKFPDDCIDGAKVTHIWTQSQTLSQQIARATYIEHVVDEMEDMSKKVDGLLLARDDANNHYYMSKPFIEAGLPIYIDKPLAFSVEQAKSILALEQYAGQVFSCSALRFAKEFQLSQKDKTEIGVIKHVDACVMKDWEKYSVHIIDPVLNIVGHHRNIKTINQLHQEHTCISNIKWEDGLTTSFSTLGTLTTPIVIRLFGETGFKELIFQDTFYAFRAALASFVTSIRERTAIISRECMLKVVEVIEKGGKIE